jgi:hypothetical protein
LVLQAAAILQSDGTHMEGMSTHVEKDCQMVAGKLGYNPAGNTKLAF